MARDKTIKFLRTTRANLDTQKTASGLLAGEPYLITDEDRLAIGTAVNAYSDLAKKSEVDGKLSKLLAIKTADETVNNSATLQDDDHLTLSVEANSNYILHLYLVGDQANATPALKAALTVPSGTTFSGSVISNRASTALLENNVNDLTNMLNSNTWTSATNALAYISGVLSVGSTAGTITLQWSQITATAAATKILKGSYLLLIKV